MINSDEARIHNKLTAAVIAAAECDFPALAEMIAGIRDGAFACNPCDDSGTYTTFYTLALHWTPGDETGS